MLERVSCCPSKTCKSLLLYINIIIIIIILHCGEMEYYQAQYQLKNNVSIYSRMVVTYFSKIVQWTATCIGGLLPTLVGSCTFWQDEGLGDPSMAKGSINLSTKPGQKSPSKHQILWRHTNSTDQSKKHNSFVLDLFQPTALEKQLRPWAFIIFMKPPGMGFTKANGLQCGHENYVTSTWKDGHCLPRDA